MKRNKIVEFLSSPIGLLLLIGFVLRICLFFMFKPYNHLDEVIVSDGAGYHKLAVHFIRTYIYQIPNSNLDSIRPPVYPFFLAVNYFLFGINISAPILAQQFIALASVFLLYRIGSLLFAKKNGFIAAVILCFEPDHIFYSFDLVSDTLYVFLFLLSTYFMIVFFQRDKLWHLILGVFLLGIATLDRPINIFTPILLAAIFCVKAYFCNESWMKVLKYSGIVLIVFLMTIAPWSIRNKITYDSYALSSITGINLLDFNVATTIRSNTNEPLDSIRDDLYEQSLLIGDSVKMNNNSFYDSNIKTKVALDYIKQNKWDYIKANLLGIMNLYGVVTYKVSLNRFFRMNQTCDERDVDYAKVAGGSLSRLLKKKPVFIIIAFANLSYLIASYILALLGGIFLLKEKKYTVLISILFVIGYFTVLTGVVGIVVRYKLPISPFYILLIPLGMKFVKRWIKICKAKNIPSVV